MESKAVGHAWEHIFCSKVSRAFCSKVSRAFCSKVSKHTKALIDGGSKKRVLHSLQQRPHILSRSQIIVPSPPVAIRQRATLTFARHKDDKIQRLAHSAGPSTKGKLSHSEQTISVMRICILHHNKTRDHKPSHYITYYKGVWQRSVLRCNAFVGIVNMS